MKIIKLIKILGNDLFEKNENSEFSDYDGKYRLLGIQIVLGVSAGCFAIKNTGRSAGRLINYFRKCGTGRVY